MYSQIIRKETKDLLHKFVPVRGMLITKANWRSTVND